MADILKVKVDNAWIGIPSIQGPKGDPGDTGPAGATGPAGPKGEDGSLKTIDITGLNQLDTETLNKIKAHPDEYRVHDNGEYFSLAIIDLIGIQYEQVGRSKIYRRTINPLTGVIERDTYPISVPEDVATKDYVDQSVTGLVATSEMEDYVGEQLLDYVTIESYTDDMTEINTAIAGKQATLTAGDNITIENNVISATGGESDTFVAEYGVTTFEEITAAVNAGKAVLIKYNNLTYSLSTLGSNYLYGTLVGDTAGGIKYISYTDTNGWTSGYNSAHEPAAFIKSAAVNGNTLTLTNKDDTTVEFTPEGGGGTQVSVSETGTATDEVNYITIDGTEYKLAGSGGSVNIDGKTIITDDSGNIRTAIGGYEEDVYWDPAEILGAGNEEIELVRNGGPYADYDTVLGASSKVEKWWDNLETNTEYEVELSFDMDEGAEYPSILRARILFENRDSSSMGRFELALRIWQNEVSSYDEELYISTPDYQSVGYYRTHMYISSSFETINDANKIRIKLLPKSVHTIYKIDNKFINLAAYNSNSNYMSIKDNELSAMINSGNGITVTKNLFNDRPTATIGLNYDDTNFRITKGKLTSNIGGGIVNKLRVFPDQLEKDGDNYKVPSDWESGIKKSFLSEQFNYLSYELESDPWTFTTGGFSINRNVSDGRITYSIYDTIFNFELVVDENTKEEISHHYYFIDDFFGNPLSYYDWIEIRGAITAFLEVSLSIKAKFIPIDNDTIVVNEDGKLSTGNQIKLGNTTLTETQLQALLALLG